jgi:hypothetical protein
MTSEHTRKVASFRRKTSPLHAIGACRSSVFLV